MTDKSYSFFYKFLFFACIAFNSHADTGFLKRTFFPIPSVVLADKALWNYPEFNNQLKINNESTVISKVKIGVVYSIDDFKRTAYIYKEPYLENVDDDSDNILGFYIKTQF